MEGERKRKGSQNVDRGSVRPGEDRVHVRVDDVDDAGQLIRYAVAAQLARLEQYGISQTAVAKGAGAHPSKLTLTLKGRPTAAGGSGAPEGEWLRSLDSSIVGLAPDTETLGGLNSLGIRLRGLEKQDTLIAHLPASWAWEMLQEDAETEFAVLTQASALLSLFIPIGQAQRSPSELRHKYKHIKIQPLVKRLALIGGAPPTSRNVDALVLLGGLTKCAWDKDLADLVGKRLRDSPLGFRLWRAITKLVHLCAADPAAYSHVKGWVATLLKDSDELRGSSIYPGRSLDLELAIAIPYAWSRPDGPGPDGQNGDWVRKLLLGRARDPKATLRERGTAALGLWQRVLSNNPAHATNPVQGATVGQTERELRELADLFAQPETRPDAAAGMRWVASTLTSVLDAKVPVCNQWPQPEPEQDPWFQVVQDATRVLDTQEIPERILGPTKVLFQHMLLQNAGVQRRQATDAILAGGWTDAVIHGLAHVLQEEKKESWLRVRALFAIGYLQCRDDFVARVLVEACREAYRKLTAKDPTDAQITEMHGVLFAIGDCFGASFGARDRSKLKSVRSQLSPILEELATGGLTEKDPRLYPVARALVYLLTFTAQDRRAQEKDLAERLLESMSTHPDPLTRAFCHWTLRFRFTHDGKVQSLLHAADFEDD
ncbi:hypothetical protein [Streptomyces sp. NPDC001070]